MKIRCRLIGLLVLILIIVGCNSNDNNVVKDDGEVAEKSEQKKDEPTEKQKEKAQEEAEVDDTYPLPILPGWEEVDIEFRTIGDGTIDIWDGEYSYDGEIEDYFIPYQEELEAIGYEVIVSQDDEGMKSIEFSKNEDGKNLVGNALFTQNWVKSSVQHFK